MNWAVVIPAGGLVEDPLASTLGTPRKALAPLDETTSITKVVQAAHQAGLTHIKVISGEELAPRLPHGDLLPESTGQIANARVGVDDLPPEIDAILFLPSDAPLLTPQAIQDYIQKVESRVTQTDWFSAGIAHTKDFQALFPTWQMNTLKLKDGEFNSGPYFATSRTGFYKGADLFEQMSSNRKSMIKMVIKLGIGPLFRYLFHLITIKEAEERLGKVLGGQALIIPNCDALGIADIDTPEDYQQILDYIKAQPSDKTQIEPPQV